MFLLEVTPFSMMITPLMMTAMPKGALLQWSFELLLTTTERGLD